jgi:hypothetical protein
MTRKSWDEIEASLRDDIEKKRAAYFQARQEFDRAITPSGIPHPDGVFSIRNCGSAHTMALKAYRLALAEHHDFYLRGVIPNRFILVGPPYGKNL